MKTGFRTPLFVTHKEIQTMQMDATVIVPEKHLESFQTGHYWLQFINKHEENIANVTAQGYNTNCRFRMNSKEPPGISFLCTGSIGRLFMVLSDAISSNIFLKKE